MNISIGIKEKLGPWGGGNHFFHCIKKNIHKYNSNLVTNLDQSGLDIVLLFDVRKNSLSSSYDLSDVINYKKKNPKTKIILRVNECDERKGTKFVNKDIIEAINFVDGVIFISDWLKNLFITQGAKPKKNVVIRNGADSNIYYKTQDQVLKKKKLSIVTHHWSSNKNKGMKVYKKLDRILFKKKFREKFDFEYIGNKKITDIFFNTKITKPLYLDSLAEKLRSKDFYITGSLNEPAGMHHIEASLCGLPVMYINSGGITEYNIDYGLEYNANNLEDRLLFFYDNFCTYYRKLKNYPYDDIKMIDEYFLFFNKIL